MVDRALDVWEGYKISVTGAQRDWQSLARKLERGTSLPLAAEQCGIPLDEARAWAKEELKQSEYDVINLHRIADTALEDAFNVLRRIAHEGPRHANISSSDLDAAKALAKLALDARKVSGGGSGRGGDARGSRLAASVQLDLFDVRGPWELEDPNKT